MTDDKVLKTAEVSKVLRLYPDSVKAIPPDELPYFAVNNRGDRRYRLADVLAYIERRTRR